MLVAVGVVTVGLAAPAFADSLIDPFGFDESYNPIGVRVGQFIIYPSVEAGVGFTDNTFQTSGNTTEDGFYLVSPSVYVASNFARHEVDLLLDLDAQKFFSEDSEDVVNFFAESNGKLDLSRGLSVDTTIAYAIDHESRGAPDVPVSVSEPPRFQEFDTSAIVSYQPNRFGVAAGGGYGFVDYDTETLNNGGIVDNNDRDRDSHFAMGEVSYEFLEEYTWFLRGTYTGTDFDRTLDRSGVNRDSEEVSVLAGIQFEVSRLIVGEIGVGYFERQYDDSTLPDIDGVDYNVELEWSATPLLTVTASGSRSVEETIIAGASGSLDHSGGLALDWRILRNLTVDADVNYTNSEFEGTGRSDDLITAGVGASYAFTNNVAAVLSYDHTDRDSSVNASDYDENTVTFGLRLSL